MAIVGDIVDRKDRPAYVRFERVAVEDVAATKKAGHYVARDVDYALITPPYSKDVFKQKVEAWKDAMRQQVNEGRMPKEWMDNYLNAYEAWRNGQEIPLNGTPIKGWGVISPAQQETLIKMMVLTVEDLAAINDEGIRRIGMGGTDLKNKAAAWLSQLNDKGPLTIEISSLKSENASLQGQVDTLSRQVKELMAAVKAQPMRQHNDAPSGEITASDILPEEPVDAKPSDIMQAPISYGELNERDVEISFAAMQAVDPPKRGPGRPRKVL